MALLLANPGPSLDRVEKIKRRLTTVRRLLKKQEEAEREKSELQKKVLQMQLAMKEQEAEHNAELSNLYNSTGELQNMELKVLQLGKEKALRMLAVKQGIRERMSNSGALPQSTSSDRTPTSQLSAAAQAAGVQLPDEVMAALEAGMAKLNLQRQGAPAQPHDPPFQAFSFPSKEKPLNPPGVTGPPLPGVTPTEGSSFVSAQEGAQWFNPGAIVPRRLQVEEVSSEHSTPPGVMMSEAMIPDQGGNLAPNQRGSWNLHNGTWMQGQYDNRPPQHGVQFAPPSRPLQGDPMAMRIQQWSQNRSQKSSDSAPQGQDRVPQPYAEQGSNLWGAGLEKPPVNMVAPTPSQELPTIVDGVISRAKPNRDEDEDPQKSFSFERAPPLPRKQRDGGDDGGNDPNPTSAGKDEPKGRYRMLAANVTLDHKNSPEFTAAPGIIPNMEFQKKAKYWWTDNANKVWDNLDAQLNQMLRCSVNETATQFIVTHKDEIAALCPDAQPLLDTLTSSTSAVSMAKTFANKAVLFKTAAVTPQISPQEARRKKAHDMSIAKHLLASFQDSTGNAAKDDLADIGEVPLWWAFIIVVMHHLCKALPRELLIYENEMKMGTPNPISPHVQSSETPSFFFVRVQETYKLFNQFDKGAFHRISSKKDPLDTFNQGLPIDLQEVAENAYKELGTEIPHEEATQYIVTRVQAAYSYSISLQGKNGLSAGPPKGLMGGWFVRSDATKYLGSVSRTAPYPDTPIKPDTARSRFTPEKHPSKYPRRPHVLYDKVTQEAIPVAVAAAAAASREFVRAHLDVDEDEAQAMSEFERLDAHSYDRFDDPDDDELHTHAHVGVVDQAKPKVSFTTPASNDPLKTMHPRGTGAPAMRNTGPPMHKSPVGTSQPARVSNRLCVLCFSKDHFADRCPHLQAVQSSPEMLAVRKRLSIQTVHAQVADIHQEDPLEETLAVDPNPPPIPAHWTAGSYTSHLEHAQHMATHPDWPPGMPAPIADAFSYACHVGLQWPIEAGMPVSCSSDVSLPQPSGTALVAGSLSKANNDPVITTEAKAIMPVEQQALRDNDSPQDNDSWRAHQSTVPSPQDRPLTIDSVNKADALTTYSRESKKVYPASFLPERDPAKLRAAADPPHSKITLPPTQHLITTSGDVSVPTAPPQKQSSAPSAQLFAQPPARTSGDKTQRPLSFQAASPVINPWENLSKGTAALAAPDALSVRLTASSDAPLPGDIQASPAELITRYLASLNPRLSYFPREEDPFRQVGLMIHGQKVWTPGMLHDWGSDVAIMSHDFCIRHRIPIFPTSMRLSTSNGVSTALEGCTAPICISYGAGGGDREIRTSHSFLVVKSRPGAPFTILIGNKDGCDWGGVHDMGTHTLSFRTQWKTKGAQSPMLSFPLDFRRP